MRKHLSLMLLLLLLITCTACGQRQTVRQMAADRITQAESVSQLQEVSDLIVVFTPERQENVLSYFSDGNVSGGYTRTTGTVSQVLKGEPPEQLVITEECYLVDNVLWTQGGYLPMQEGACLPLMVSSLIFALIFKRVENMEICYIEAGVLERMLARAENLSARVDRLYERNRCKEPGE